MKKLENRIPAKIVLLFCVFALASALVLTGCGKTDDSSVSQTIRFETPSDFSGCMIGSQTGTMFDDILNSAIQGLNHKYYNDITDQVLALRNGDVDAVGLDEPVAKIVAAQNPDLAVFGQIIQTDSYGFPMKKGGELTGQVSAIIEKFAADGTLERLKEKWFSGDAEEMRINTGDYSGYDTSGGELRYIHDSTQTPMSYVGDNGESAGYEVELVLMIGKALSKKVVISQANFSALIAAVASGSADIASGSVSITDERRESVDFPTSHYSGGIVLLCRKADVMIAEESSEEENSGLFDTIAKSFYKNLISESRWKLIVSGLLVTLLISLCSLVLGTLFGFFVCSCRGSGNHVIAGITAFCIRFIQGIPMVVLLMILYYMVFAASGLNEIIVAIIGFSVNFGVNSAEIIRAGIVAVDVSQREAATVLGLNKRQTFFKVILPQAIRHFLPAYKGEFINMMKMTSIVGYIAVHDVTKASDIIRSRTYEPFFPLIINALIYLLLTWLFTSLIGAIEIHTDFKRHREKKISLPASGAPHEKTTFRIPENPSSEMIELEHLAKEYDGLTIFSDVNAVIHSGEAIAIIGPSGTGKSTFLRLIARLEEPTAGKVRVLGMDMEHPKECMAVRKKMGMVFQGFHLFGHLNAIENVMLAPMTVLKMPRQEAYENAVSLLRMVGLAEKGTFYPDELSGGQQQRVAIARALAMKPEIILFDEPTSALDPTMATEVLSVIRSLAKSGLTILIVTHEMQFAKDIATRVFYLDQEGIYESGDPKQIFDSPQKEKTRQFVRKLKVLEEKIVSRDFDFIGINTRIEEFGRKCGMSQKPIIRLQTVFEELAVQTILPSLPENMELSLLVEYSFEEDKATMYLRYNGEAFDPTQSNELSMLLARNSAETIRYFCHPEEEMKNEIVIVGK